MQARSGNLSNSLQVGQRADSTSRSSQIVGRQSHRPAIAPIAFAVLMLVIAGGFSFMFADDHSSDGEFEQSIAALVFNPSAASLPADEVKCSTDDPHLGCEQHARLMGGGLVFDPSFDTAALDGKQVQLQGWRLEPGAAVPSTVAVSDATGVVVDVVLSGAYSATFDVPVKVTRGALTIRAKVEYHERGEKIELGIGDTVSYRLGGLKELSNPLDRLELEFKRVVIYQGDIASIPDASTGVKTAIDGETKLDLAPDGVTPISGTEVSVSLWYAQRDEGTPIPPESWTDATTIGPVDQQDGPAGTEGFFLVIRPALE